MLALAKASARMMVIVGDDGDDLIPLRREMAARETPPFPWNDLRHILLLTMDGYAINTRANPTPMSTHRVFDGVRWGPIFESSKYGPVATALSRSFVAHATRHKTSWKHFAVLMAVELGLVQHPDSKGLLRWCLYRPERSDALMPVHEAAAVFGLATDSVYVYLSNAKKAVNDEWRALYDGTEQ